MAGGQDWSNLNDDDMLEAVLGHSVDDFGLTPAPAPAKAPAPAAEAKARAQQNITPSAPIVQAPKAQPAQLGLPGLGGGMPSWAKQAPTSSAPAPIDWSKVGGGVLASNRSQPPVGDGEIDLLAGKKRSQGEPQPGIVQRAWNFVKEQGAKAAQDFATIPGDVWNDPAAPVREFGKGIVSDVLGVTASGTGALVDVLENPLENVKQLLSIAAYGSEKAARIRKMDEQNPLSLDNALRGAGEGLKAVGEYIGPGKDRENLATQISGAIGQIGGQVAATLLTGGFGGGITLAAQGADQMDERVRAAGKQDTAEGDLSILSAAAITTAMEKTGLDRIMEKVPDKVKNSLLRRVADIAQAGGVEAVTEVGEGVLHNLTAATLLEDKSLADGATWKDSFAGALNDAEVAGGAGAVARLVVGALEGKHASLKKQIEDRNLQAGADADIDALGTARDATFAAMSPDQGEQFIRPGAPAPAPLPAAGPAPASAPAPAPAPVAQEGMGGMEAPAPAAAQATPETPFGAVGARVTVQQKDGAIGGKIVDIKPVSNPAMGVSDNQVTIQLDDGSIVEQLAGTLEQSGIVAPEAQPTAQAPAASPDGSLSAEQLPDAAVSPTAPSPGAGEPDNLLNPAPLSTEEGSPAAEAPEPTDVAESVHHTLANGGSYPDIRQLRKEAEKFYGAAIRPDSDEAKKVEEDAELGVVMAARDIVRNGGGDAPTTFDNLVDLYERQPNLIQRNSVSVTNQAYSTPAPLAYVASRLAGVTGDKRVYEPTAGNGMLLIEADPTNVVANEKNPDRVEALNRVYGDGHITEGDALGHSPDGEFDVVISNPPFGNQKLPRPGGGFMDRNFDRYAGFPTTQIDHAIAVQALHKMKKDGRAVLIVGARKTDDRPGLSGRNPYQGDDQIRFYRHLFDNYNVTQLFTVDGALYKKQGAQWPVNVIVIEGKKGAREAGNSTAVPPYKALPKVYSSWGELGELLSADVHASEQQDGTGNGDAGEQAAASDQSGSVSAPSGAAVSEPNDGRGPAGTGTVSQPAGDAGQSAAAGQEPTRTADGGTQSDAPRNGSVSEQSDTAGAVDGRSGDGERAGKRDAGNAEPAPADVTKTLQQEGKSAADKLTDLAASGNKDAQGLIDRLTADERAPKSNGGKVEVTIQPNSAKTILLFDPSRRLESLIRNAIPKASIDYSASKEGWIIPSRWTDQLKGVFDVIEDSPIADTQADELKAAQIAAEKAREEAAKAEAERHRAEVERVKNERIEAIKAKAAQDKADIAAETAPAPAADDFDSVFDSALDEQFGSNKTPTYVDGLDATDPAHNPYAGAKDAGLTPAEQRELNQLRSENAVGDLDQEQIDRYLDLIAKARNAALAAQERTPAQAAKSAASNVAGGLSESTKALVSIFNDLAKDQAGSLNFEFKADVYEKAKPHFVAALEHFRGAASDITDMVRKLVQHLAENGLTRSAVDAMRPYIKRFVSEVQSGAVKLGQKAAELVKAAPKKERAANSEEETEHQVQYEPKSGANFAVGTLVPKNMQDALDAAFDKLQERVGDIDSYVAKNLGMSLEELNKAFSAEQVDALALAMNNVEQGAGFIIGDQTGVGKGRFVAGMLRYAMMQEKVPVFITKDAGLYGDMIRDLRDIGMKDIDKQVFVSNRDLRGSKAIPLGDGSDPTDVLSTPTIDKEHVKQLDRIAATGQLPTGYRMYFTTYSQNQFTKGKPSRMMPALEALAPNAMFIMDESHMAGGTAKERQQVDKDGNPILDRSQFFRNVLKDVQGVVYSSATYAKNPHTMSLYFKTDISLAVDDVEQLPAAMAQGGVPLQQIIANMLVLSGQYVRRERTFAGVKFQMDQVATDEARAEKTIGLLRNIFDLDVTIMQEVREAFIEQMAEEGEIAMGGEDSAVGGQSANGTNFANVMHNIVAQMLLALKTESVANWAVDEIKAGRKPLIALMNTNDAILGDYIEDTGATNGDQLNVPFNVIIQRYLDRLRRITIKDRETEKVTYRWISLDELEEIAGPEAREEYERVEDMIRNTNLMGLSATPIDTMMDRIRDAGFKVDEITGRQRTIKNGILDQRYPSNAEKKRVMNGFNSGKLDALVLNNAGSTGYSMHATAQPGNDGKQRHMMIIQPDPDINVFMQMLGRIHRTGQTQLPIYTIATSSLTAEKRVAAILMKKMASLNANTTASADSATTLKNVVNIMNQYGDKVVANYLRENREIATMTDTMPGQDISDLAKKFFGRMAILPTKLADEVYEAIESEYVALMDSLDAMGENTLKATTLELDARTVSKEVFIPSSDDGSDSPFAAPAYVEEVDVKKLGRPMKPEEIQAEITKALDDEVPDADKSVRPTRWAEKMQTKLDDLMPSYMESKQGDLRKAQEVLAAAKTDKQKERAQERVNSWNQAIDLAQKKLELAKQALMDFRPGKVFTISYGDDYKVTAVSLGVDLKSVKSNPTAFGSMTVKFAVSDASRRLGIPLSQLISAAEEQSGAEMGDRYEVQQRFGNWSDAMRDFDQGDEVRERRTIMTGNLVASYAKLPQGQIVQFRRDDGSLADGILMKQGFDLNKELDKLPVRFGTAEQIIKFLEKTRMGLASSFEPRGGVQFAIGNDWSNRDDIILRVGNKHKALYQAKQVTDAVGRAFNQSRGKRSQWTVTIERSRMPEVVKAYQELGIEFGTETFKDEARAVTNPEGSQRMAQKIKAQKKAAQSTRMSPGERAAMGARLRRNLDKLGLHDVALKVAKWIDPTEWDAERVDGFYDPMQSLIVIAQSSDSPEWTVGHEAIHAMRAMDLFTPVEWRAMAHSITADEMARIREMYPDINHEGQIEEAIAERFGRWYAQRNTERGFFRTAFEKIVKLIDAVRDALSGGYDPTDPDNVFRRIQDGTIGSREGGIIRQGPTKYGPRSMARKVNGPQRPDEQTRKEAADAAEFDDAETERRWQDGRKGLNVNPETWRARAASSFSDWAKKFARHWVHLPNHPMFSDVMQQLRKLEAAPENAREDIMHYLKGLTEGFNADDMELFARKVVLDDLMFDLDKDRDIPFGFTPDSLRAAHKNVTEQIRKAGLEDAVNKRRLVVQTVADDMVKAGVLTKEQVENPYYYRHQVLEYARAEVTAEKRGLFGTSTKTVRKPYWHGRQGSILDINANILEAEMDWLYKALVDIQAAKTIDWIKHSPLNIRQQVTAKARAHNDAAIADMIDADIKANGYSDGKGGMTSPLDQTWKDYQRRIAMGVDGVRRVLKDGHLTNIPAHLQASADAILNQETSDEGFFGLFSWMIDNNKQGANWAAAAFNAINARREFMQTSLGKDFANTRDIESLVRKGFAPEGYAIWQPDPGKVMFTSKVVTEHALDRFVTQIAGDAAGMDVPDAVRAAFKDQAKEVLMIGGDKYQFIIPQELADTLDNFSDARTEELLNGLVQHVTSAWKKWTLFMPRRVAKYMLNNMSGDVDAIIAGNPGVLSKLKQATKEVMAVARGENPTEAYLEARQRGVFGSAITAQEIQQISSMDEFKALSRAEDDAGIATKITRGYFRKVMALNNGRETILRYAAYLDYKDKMDRGIAQERIGYGASSPEMVKAVTDKADRAALLARDLLGDYGAISYNGAKLRKGWMPFFSWMEINTKRYWRLNANAWNTSWQKGVVTGSALMASAATRRGLWLYVRMAMLHGAITLFNNLFFPDDEDKLEAAERMQLHLFIGHWGGETKSIRLQGAFSDALSWIGYGDVMAAYDLMEKGQLTTKDAIKTILGAPTNKLWSQLTPMVRTPLELYTGKQTWPDVWEPTSIKDSWKHAFKTFSLDNEYVAARNLAASAGVGTPKASRSGYLGSLVESLVYSRDPGEIAYNRVKGLASRFEASRTGESGQSGSSTDNSRLLYEYRTALRYGETEKAEELRKALLDLRDPVDGRRVNTPEKIRQAEQRAAPLYGIPQRYRDDFKRSLTEDEQQALHDADQWYRETFR